MAGILICDDNPNIRYLLRVFVESKTGRSKFAGKRARYRGNRESEEASAGFDSAGFIHACYDRSGGGVCAQSDAAAHKNNPLFNAHG
jgi:hypothetical protein